MSLQNTRRFHSNKLLNSKKYKNKEARNKAKIFNSTNTNENENGNVNIYLNNININNGTNNKEESHKDINTFFKGKIDNYSEKTDN